MSEFIITWPIWLLTTEESVVRDELGNLVCSKRPAFDVVRQGDKARLIVFTDQDLADRYLLRFATKWVKVSLNDPDDFAWLLRSLAKAGVTSVLFDPEPVGTAYSIEAVLAAVEGGPV